MASWPMAICDNTNIINNNDNGDDEDIPDTLPIEESQSQSQSQTPDYNKNGIWGVLVSQSSWDSNYKKVKDISDSDESIKIKELPTHNLTKNEYRAGRTTSLDIQFNQDNTEEKKLYIISKLQFIIKRERITLYEKADYKGDFVVTIHDVSANGTFINKKKLENRKAILLHNDIISIGKPCHEAYKYLQTTPLVEVPEELSKKYIALRILGKGICGPVKLIYSKSEYYPMALKCISKSGDSMTVNNDMINDSRSFMNEVNILKDLKHPNIIKMIHTLNAPLNLFIFLELMQGGELFDRIRKSGGLSEKLSKFYFYQILTAVEYLHANKITHRDLKPENILLLNNEKYTLVKLTDFGMSKLVNHETMMKTFCGTPYYAAPEILKHKGSSQYTSQVDVWSLGVILYVMLSGCVPFQKKGNKELTDVIIEGEYFYPSIKFDVVSRTAKNLIDSMLVVSPSLRITVSQAVASSWLDDKKLLDKINSLLKSTYFTGNNNDNNNNNNNNCENKSPNTDSGIESSQRNTLDIIQAKRQRLE